MQNQNNKALTAAALRGLVAAYLIYLGWKIITNQDTDMAQHISYLLGGGLILAAVLFGGYIVYRLRADLQAQKQQNEENGNERTE